VDDQVIHELSDHDRTDYRARHMGFVFQFFNLLPVLTAAENVELPLLLAGLSSAEARRRATEALSAGGLEGWANRRPSQLSGGQRQRTTVARALVNNPAIVWADEPTGNLDSGTADEIMSLIEELNARNGQTFVIVTHDPSIGERSHRVVHMRDGQIENETRHRPIEPAASAGA
jgi:putative ABC transport system ATP-binding protein